MISNAEANALRIVRTIDAPIQVVWDLWTKPEHFAAWYGPVGASVPVAEMDVRAGGTRRVCMAMNTPRGERTMWFVGTYLDVAAPYRLVYTEAMADEAGNLLAPLAMGMPEGHPAVTEITVELEADGERTRMRLTHAGIPADSPGAAGWHMALDKLEVHVQHLKPA